jgi:hypothetical protein
MTANVIDLDAARAKRSDRCFGACPICGCCDGYLNVERSHYAICKTHKAYWCIGGNLFDSWRHDTQAKWNANAALLETFTEVEPIFDKTIDDDAGNPLDVPL